MTPVQHGERLAGAVQRVDEQAGYPALSELCGIALTCNSLTALEIIRALGVRLQDDGTVPTWPAADRRSAIVRELQLETEGNRRG